MSSYFRDSTAFAIAAGAILTLAIASTRWYVSDLAIHRTVTRRNILTLLEQRTLPFRGDTSHAILAAVQAITAETAPSPCGSGDGEGDPCDQIDSLHESFAALQGIVDCRSLTGTSFFDVCVKSSATHAYDAMHRRYRPRNPDQWQNDVARRTQRYVIADCPAYETFVPSEGGAAVPIHVHDQVYGPAGCDTPGAASITRLLVPSRSWASFRSRIADRAGIPFCPEVPLGQETSLEESNDFSMLMEPLLEAHLRVAPEPGPADGRRGLPPQIVQAYFLSPDSMIRYWDVQHRDAVTILSHARLWGASPFVELPLERQSRFPGPLRAVDGDVPSPASTAQSMCASIPQAPYIDYGGYGLVRSRCSCAVDTTGRLLGVFCTDYTLPVLPTEEDRPEPAKVSVEIPDDHGTSEKVDVLETAPNSWLKAIMGWFLDGPSTERNNLLSWATVRIPHDVASGRTCAGEIIVGDAHRFPMKNRERPEPGGADKEDRAALASELCARVQALRDGFFQDIQSLNESGRQDSRAYFVPTGRAGVASDADHLGLILRPQPRYTPVRGLIFALTWWGLFFVAIVARAYVERADLARLRDESILRSLPAGVIDVSHGHFIDHANDRAEEVLMTTLRTFGAENDLADTRDLLELVDPVFLRLDLGDGWSGEPEAPEDVGQFHDRLVFCTLHEVALDRRGGRVSQYYARLQAGADERGERWVSIKGSPLLESSRRARVEERTFAVVQRVQGPIRSWLNNKADENETLKNLAASRRRRRNT